MLIIEKLLEYLKSRREQSYDPRPLYYPGDGSVAERKERLVNERMREYQEALVTYRDFATCTKVQLYLEGLKQRVDDARNIQSYDDWENEMMRSNLQPPKVRPKHDHIHHTTVVATNSHKS